MAHDEIRELIPLLAIGRLEGEKRKIVEDHLKSCSKCHRIYEAERNLTQMMEEMSDRVVVPRVVRKGISIWKYVPPAISAAAVLLIAIFLLKVPSFRKEQPSYHPSVEIVGLDDLWDGYVLVQSNAPLEVEMYVDGEKVAEHKGENYAYLTPEVSRGEHYVLVKVVSEGDTLIFDKIVEYDPEVYTSVIGEGLASQQ